jgi:spermidine/putrescine transport system substrate-binding protein
MRRVFTVTTAALLASAATAAAQSGQLNIYNWGNYTPPEMIEKFEAETGIRVTVTDYDSNDTALTTIRQGGHGYDVAVPSNNYVPIYVQEGLVMELDHDAIPNIANIDPQWVDVPFDEGRRHSVPWAWGTTGVIVNTSVYDGEVHDAGLIFDPPEALRGRINVIPEMTDIMHLAVRYQGGEPCTGDMDLLREVRDMLNAAKEHWLALDYGTVDAYAAGDIAAGIYWNGASMRARLQNEDLAYGYPQTGYPVWMDNAVILADAQNPEAAVQFLNFVLEPENAALISNFTRYANGVVGSEEYMDPEMREAPEIVVPDGLDEAARFSVTCPSEVNQIYTQIWTELLQ